MKYYSDGFLTGKNPSVVGGGFTIVNENNTLIKRITVTRPNFTNNEAELLGCLEALTIAEDGDVVSTDSMNTIRWIIGADKMHDKRARKDLDPLKKRALYFLQSKKIELIWEPRDMNLAGILNEEILDSK